MKNQKKNKSGLSNQITTIIYTYMYYSNDVTTLYHPIHKINVHWYECETQPIHPVYTTYMASRIILLFF